MLIGDITPYPNNPRKNREAIAKVVKSVREYGFRQPLVIDEKNVIIVGHTRYYAAVELGMDTVPVHVASLSKAKARAYRIADNRTGQEATWDIDKLTVEIDAIGRDVFTGFDQAELDDIFNVELPKFSPEDAPDDRLDQMSMIACPHCGAEFQRPS